MNSWSSIDLLNGLTFPFGIRTKKSGRVLWKEYLLTCTFIVYYLLGFCINVIKFLFSILWPLLYLIHLYTWINTLFAFVLSFLCTRWVSVAIFCLHIASPILETVHWRIVWIEVFIYHPLLAIVGSYAYWREATQFPKTTRIHETMESIGSW